MPLAVAIYTAIEILTGIRHHFRRGIHTNVGQPLRFPGGPSLHFVGLAVGFCIRIVIRTGFGHPFRRPIHENVGQSLRFPGGHSLLFVVDERKRHGH